MTPYTRLAAVGETELRKPGMFFRRSAGGEEIDFIVEQQQRLLPIEVKSARSLRTADARAVGRFCEEFGRRAPFGVLLYDGNEIFELTQHTLAVPLRAVV